MKKELNFFSGKYKKIFLNYLVLLLLGLPISKTLAQTNTVTGTVKDNSGEVLPEATILEKGTTNGTTTDFDGNFSINVKSNATLIISYLGYTTKEIAIRNNLTLNIVLQSDNALDEIVVIGYGTAKKSDVTMAVSTVGSKSFKDQPIFRAEDALQSRAAGVQVVKSTGAPGGSVKLRIRGTSSISRSSSPLIVIDGVAGGNINSINPNDIASFDVLKDASSSAIYGARGANGVILITTKRGSGKPKIEANYFSTISYLPKKLPQITPQQYADLYNVPLIENGTDYQDEFFTTSLTNNFQLSARGQEGKLRYYLSTNYVDQEGIVINTDYNRLTLRTNLETKFGKKLKLGLNISGSRSQGHNLFREGARASSDNRGGVLSILTYNPTFPVRNADGTYYDLEPQALGSILVNPIAVINEKNNNSTQDRLGLNFNLNYDFLPSLKYTLTLGSNTLNTLNENYSLVPDGSSLVGPRAGFSSSGLTNYQITNTFNYKKSFGETDMTLTAAYELNSIVNKRVNGNSGEYSLGGIPDAFYLLELGTAQTVGANFSDRKLQSYIGRAQFSVGNNFDITGSLRYDQSSTFRKENRNLLSPAISGSYSFQDYFSKDDEFLNNIKARVGWGKVGNDGGFLGTYSRLALAASQNYSFNGTSLSNGLGYAGVIDQDLKWELTKQTNVGLDFSLLKNQLNISVDWYKKNSEDLLLDAVLPSSAGDPDGEYRTNIGEIQNTGLDIDINADIISTDDLYWNANLNVSTIKNKVIALAPDQEQLLYQPPNIGGANGDTAYILEVGQPLGQFYGAQYLGTWKTGEDPNQIPGTIKYATDEFGEVIFGAIGNGLPEVTWGLNQTLTYKKFNVNFVLRGVHGFEVYNDTYAQMVAGKTPIHPDILNMWTPNRQTDVPTNTDNIRSDRFIENGSFIRLSNITLGYTLENINFLNSAKIYVSGQNLFTITDYRGYDPEVSSTDNSTDQGPSYDKGAFPNPRTITFGLNLKF